jgi:hypothetical protein
MLPPCGRRFGRSGAAREGSLSEYCFRAVDTKHPCGIKAAKNALPKEAQTRSNVSSTPGTAKPLLPLSALSVQNFHTGKPEVHVITQQGWLITSSKSGWMESYAHKLVCAAWRKLSL